MHIHILGICGTFMSGIAVIAKQQGHRVSGSDESVYPPMSIQLSDLGIRLTQGYDADQLQPAPDLVIIGNAISRGNPAVEYVLEQDIPYVSGPEWLAKHCLQDKWVLAVAGTHGKTSTASMLAWILDYSGMAAGFLIGGIPVNFEVSARYTNAPFFVIEADEYDTAFFDKRSKFIHFHPRTLVLTGLEFDHADIFPDLDAIKTQFQYLLRTVPSNGLIVSAGDDENLKEVISRGCWTSTETFANQKAEWQVQKDVDDSSKFKIYYRGDYQGTLSWSQIGDHNMRNALAAIAAAKHAGVSPEVSISALSQFNGVKRRMELRGQVQGVSVYDDFAHHPTAISTTLSGLRAKVTSARIIAVMDFASYTMRSGVHRDKIADSLKDANYVLMMRPQLDWGVDEVLDELSIPGRVYNNVNDIITDILTHAQSGDHVLIMSNRGFDGIHDKLIKALQTADIGTHGSPLFG